MRSKDRPRPQPPRAQFLPSRRRRRPLFDLLEDRVVLSRIITVNTLSDAAGLPSGQVSLRSAITQADSESGDTIAFKKGLTGAIALGSALPEIGSKMTISGPGASKLIVQGGGAGSDFSVLSVDSGVSLTITNLTLAGGDAGDDESAFGGGLSNEGSVVASGLVVAGNSAYHGGGIWNGPTGTLTFTRGTVSDNTAIDAGGGIDNEGSLTLADSILSGNQAPGRETTYYGYSNFVGGNGGGVANAGTLTAAHTTWTGNSAYSVGGGLSNVGGTITVTGSTFDGNSSSASSGGGLFNFGTAAIGSTSIIRNTASYQGGGVYNAGPMTISDGSVIDGNAAEDSGGGILSQDYSPLLPGFPVGSLTVIDSSITNNAANGDSIFAGGGGIDARADLELIGCTVSDNTTAGSGGGIRISDLGFGPPSATIVDSTISGNSAAFGGGFSSGGDTSLAGTTVSGNTAPRGGGILNDGTIAIDDSAIEGNSAARGGGLLNQGDASITGGTISGNSAASGGGIADDGTLVVDSTLVTGNTATSQSFPDYPGSPYTFFSGGDGGGLLVSQYGSATFTDSTITGNTADGGRLDVQGYFYGTGYPGGLGGGINNQGTLTLSGTVVSGNRALTTTVVENDTPYGDYAILFGGAGGGLYNDGSVTISKSSIADNAAAYGDSPAGIVGTYLLGRLTGGGVQNDEGGTVSIEDSVVSGNSAAQGAGLDNSASATLGLVGTEVSGNTASDSGGGIRNSGLLTIAGGSITGNASGSVGGGIDSNGTLTVTDLIISGNAASNGGGGINNGGEATITGATLSGNSGRDGGGLAGYGGASTTVRDSKVVGNSSTERGGGINNDGSTVDVERCDVLDNGSRYHGGGIANHGGTLTVLDSTISGNSLPNSQSENIVYFSYGGGIDNQGGVATISGSTISGNVAGTGGGVSNEYFGYESRSSLTMTDCAITGNQASDPTNPFLTSLGGGLYNVADATLASCTISGNSSAGYGGGVVNGSSFGVLPGILTLTDCAITGNTAGLGGGGFLASGSNYGVSGVSTFKNCVIAGNTTPGGGGGGRVAGGGTLAMDGSTLSGNSAANGGGLWVRPAAKVAIITGSTIANNTATTGIGGGIQADHDLTLTNSTVYGNTAATDGGGIYVSGGTATLTDVTLAANRATSGTGGGIASSGGTAPLFNTLVARNFVGASGSMPGDVTGSFDASSSNDLIGDGSGSSGIAKGSQGNLVGTDAHPIDPILSPLGSYGGSTQTVALLPGSPAIGAGSSAYGPATDQRGVSRGARVDIGAFQSRGFTVAIVNGSSPQSAYVGSGFATPLAVVVASPYGEPVVGGVVTYTVNPVGGAGAVLGSATATIGAGGVASVTAAANSTPGSYTVAASASGASAAATFNLTNLAQAQVSGVSVSWGTSRTAVLTTAPDGLRLLAAGRRIDLPWLDIRRIAVTLGQAASLTAADVSVTGLTVANYGPVTISGSGTTYVITLAVPIDAADRVTLTIRNPAIATYTRRIDVLPGDVNDDGSVNSQDTTIERNAYVLPMTATLFTDIDGDGTTSINDYNIVKRKQNTTLPPLR